MMRSLVVHVVVSIVAVFALSWICDAAEHWRLVNLDDVTFGRAPDTGRCCLEGAP